MPKVLVSDTIATSIAVDDDNIYWTATSCWPCTATQVTAGRHSFDSLLHRVRYSHCYGDGVSGPRARSPQEAVKPGTPPCGDSL